MTRSLVSRIAMVMLLWVAGAGCVVAQTNNPDVPTRPTTNPEPLSPPAAAAVNATTGVAQQPLSSAIRQGTVVRPRPGVITQVGTGTAVGEGVRVLKGPGACTPKTNSLDCVQDSSQAGQGANVSGRVRNSVIGEVGTGRAITEGSGGAQRQQTCTPKPGELTCTP